MKAFFLDRDGVINHDYNYVSTIENFKFIDGIFEMLRRIQAHNYLIFIVTNQSGIGRGYYSEGDFFNLTHWMINEFKKESILIEKVLYCPHIPNQNCTCRKPRTGLIDKILKDFPLNLKDCWMVGDKESDIELAMNSGISNTIFIKGNHDKISFNKAPKYSIKSLYDFNKIII